MSFSKAPAFQFYPNDWLSSTNISLMSPAEEGAYIHLLCYAWNDPECSIPDDDTQLAALSRLGEGWLKGGSTVVRKCFEPHPEIPGRLVNKRLLEERQKQNIWREKSRYGGLKSAESRTNTRSKGGSRVVQPPYQPNGNISSSSSSSIEEKRATSQSDAAQSRVTSTRSRRSSIPDEEWIKQLQAKPAYQALDVVQILSKAEAWCEVKGKQLTRARFINWLNREDKPIQLAANGNGSAGHSGSAGKKPEFCSTCGGATVVTQLDNGKVVGMTPCGDCHGSGRKIA